jgi:hypothetical protein
MVSLEEYLDGLEVKTPFYGREAESEKLLEFLGEKSPVIVVKGPPAIGKSALTQNVLAGYNNSSVVDVGIEKGDSRYPYRVFFEIMGKLLENPQNNTEVDERLGRWYGEGDNRDRGSEKELVKALYWTYHPFEGYEGGVFSEEETERLTGDALLSFFTAYHGKEHLVVDVENYERFLLGEDKQTDDFIRLLGERLKGKNVSFVVETRDELNIGQAQISLEGLVDFPLKEYIRANTGATLDDHQLDEIRRLTRNHPYIMELLPFAYEEIPKLEGDAKLTLREVLDAAIGRVGERERNILRAICLFKRPVSYEQFAEGIRKLGFHDQEAIEGVGELVKRHLVSPVDYEGKKCLAVRNPRLGERIEELTESDEEIRIHRVLYEVAEGERDKWFHALEGEMPEEAYEDAKAIALYSTSAEAVEIFGRTIGLLENHENFRHFLVGAVYRRSAMELRKGNYELTDSRNRVRENKNLLRKNPNFADYLADFEWMDHYLGFVISRGLGEFEKAQQCMGELRRVSEQVREQRGTDDYLETAEYHQNMLFCDRAKLDSDLDENRRISLLRTCEERLEGKEEKNPQDKIVLADCLNGLSRYCSEEKGELLERAERCALESLGSLDQAHRSYVQSYALVALAETYLLKGDYGKYASCRTETEKIFEYYGGSARTRIDLLLLQRDFARIKKQGLEEQRCVMAIRDILDSTSPENLMGYRSLLGLAG